MLGNAVPLAAGSPSGWVDIQAAEDSRAVARSPVAEGTVALADIGSTAVAVGMDWAVHTVAARTAVVHTVIDTAAMAPLAEAACMVLALLGCPRSTRSRNSSRILCRAALAVRNWDRMFPDLWREPLLERRIAGKISCRSRRCHTLCKLP